MKKLFFGLVLSFVCLFAEELTLKDSKVVEQFGAMIVKEKLDSYDPNELGLKILKTYHESKYQEVKNDEFEFNDAKKWALDNFKTMKPIDKQARFYIDLEVDFGEYNFHDEYFQINALTKDSSMGYYGGNKLVAYADVVFDNPNDSCNTLNMKKDEAKEFIKSRKNQYGNVDRKLIAHYIYTIINYKEVEEFKPNRSSMRIKLMGHIESVVFMDKKKNIIQTVNY
jgi:hypothetical protein